MEKASSKGLLFFALYSETKAVDWKGMKIG
jgi:hypothetical protein